MVVDQGLPITFAQLTVEAADGPALVSPVSSLDGGPLSDTSRVLVMLATDAQNSGMRFADAEQRSLLELGQLPVLLRRARVIVRLAHNAPSGLRLYATALNGSRRESIPAGAGIRRHPLYLWTAPPCVTAPRRFLNWFKSSRLLKNPKK